MFYRIISILTVSIFALGLQACGGGVKKEVKYPTGGDRAATAGDIYAEEPSIFGGKGLLDTARNSGKDDSSGLGVNSYLWRASLDTVSFMPLASADPFGGTILTDWYEPDSTPGERFKLNVFILGKELRSDGVRVRVFRQVKKGGQWKDAEPSADMGPKLEDSILTRARQLRVRGMGGPG